MDRVYVDIGKRMRSLRIALRQTQAQVAEAAGIETSFYGQLERGANIPSLKTLFAIAKAIGAESADLLPTKAGAKVGQDEKALGRLLQRLGPKQRELALGIFGDIVRRLKK